MTEREVGTHGAPTPGFGSSRQGAKVRLVVAQAIPTKSARESFFSSFSQRYEAGRGRAQGHMQAKAGKESKRTQLI